MPLTIRKLQYEDYNNILVGWWSDWKWTAPTRDFLPDNAEGGLIVFDGDIPICAGFIYITNSKVSWVDWIISSRTYNKKPYRKEAIKYLIDTLSQVAKDNGSTMCYALIKHRGLIETYKELGYIQADTYNTEMIKKL
jgi:hypothetical protein